jgi:hypothetical protein
VSLEICYNIRYLELNGRNRGTPWSVRQTGVYQQLSNAGTERRWVFLQPSDYILERIKLSLQQQDQTSVKCNGRQVHIHFVIISAAIRNWGLYTEYIHQQIRELVGTLRLQILRSNATQEEKAHFAQVDGELYDYEIPFRDAQKASKLAKALATASAAIDGQAGVLTGCKDLHASVAEGPRDCDCDVNNTVRFLKVQIRNYQQSLLFMTRKLARISSMVGILDICSRANLTSRSYPP